jgi:3-vinyl bacteriochlorophyllide hydratase
MASHAGNRERKGTSIAEAVIEAVAPCPWAVTTGSSHLTLQRVRRAPEPMYTPEERIRRDTSVWTTVQAILAPLQFLVFLVSAGLVIRFLVTGEGYDVATLSVVIKTFVLYAIMITGSIWEKVVFGKWLFARPFFWEDVFSMLVLGLHTLYLLALWFHWGSAQDLMVLALAAYATYVINAGQFLWKLRMARLEGAGSQQVAA